LDSYESPTQEEKKVSIFHGQTFLEDMNKNWASWHLDYYSLLSGTWPKHPDVDLLLPYLEDEAKKIRSQFYHKYYGDHNPRQLWLGINPGRLGAGITGIAFSDPVCLEQYCNIENPWGKKQELSAQFIFRCINAFGGPDIFYRKVYIDAICPVGLMQQQKNFNYYDDKSYYEWIRPKIKAHLRELFSQNIWEEVIIIGKGKNERFFQELTGGEIPYQSLPHPRWIMQYKRKEMHAWVEKYLELING
jgi:hypothetical protein